MPAWPATYRRPGSPRGGSESDRPVQPGYDLDDAELGPRHGLRGRGGLQPATAGDREQRKRESPACRGGSRPHTPLGAEDFKSKRDARSRMAWIDAIPHGERDCRILDVGG
jgi:hypothetical protein